MSDDLTQLRRQQADARAALEALSAPEGRNAAALVGVVYDGGAIPHAVPRVFLTHPVGIACQEAAGDAPTITPGGESVPVLVLGPRVPVVGDQLLARQIGGLWVSQTGVAMQGYPRHNYPGCDCANVPEVLSMVNLAPACNGSMFQTCTIRYQAIPPALASLLIDVPAGSGKAWLSDGTFTVPADPTEPFRYHLHCSGGVFTLGRVYEVSFVSSPYNDATRYTWFLTAPGNTCTPFALTTGAIYAGGDPACNGQVQLFEATP